MRRLRTIKVAIQNWMRLKCKLLNRHEYVLENKYTEDILKLHCIRCKKSYGVNLKSAMIFAWDNDMALSLSILEKNLEKEVCSEASSITDIPLKIVI